MAALAGFSWPATLYFSLPLWAGIAWKGLGAALLARFAMKRGLGRCAVWLFVLVALSDMLLDLQFQRGVGLALAARLLLLAMLWPRPFSSPGMAAGALFVGGVAVLAGELAADSLILPSVLFAVVAAGAVVVSSRLSLAVGPLLLLLADLLFIGRMGVFSDHYVLDTPIWLIHVSGLLLLARALDEKARQS